MSSNTSGEAAAGAHLSGPPYPPTTANIGGTPSPTPDIAVSAVLIALYGVALLGHLYIFRRNKAAGHRFMFSVLLVGFCSARITALGLRISWAHQTTNVNIGIAANVLTSAGVLLLFIVNLLLSLRVVRGLHPAFGWSRGVKVGFAALIASVIGVLVMVVVGSVLQLFTLDVDARQRDRDVVMVASVYMTVIAFLPAVWMFLAWILPSPKGSQLPAENFGTGRMSTKMALLAFTSTLLTLGAGFRAAVNIEQKPLNDPQWYHSKPAFYCFIFVLEIVVVYTYLLFRFDQRFHVPDGSSAPGHYSGMNQDGGHGHELGHLRDDHSRDSATGAPSYKQHAYGPRYGNNYASV